MKIADAPIFRRFWYPIIAQSHLTSGPQPVSLFLEDMVVWQAANGVVSALADRCGHEAVRLSPGEVCGNHLVCPHHHWEFASDGRCVRIPQRPRSEPGSWANVRAYRAEGRYGLAWVAVDDPLQPIPEIPELESPGFRLIPVLSERWRVSTLRLAEASLDLGQDPQLAGAQVLSSEETAFGHVLQFTLPSAEGIVAGSLSWWAPAIRVLRLAYPSGLVRVRLTAAAPLADRWSVVSCLEGRNDSEEDAPGGEQALLHRIAAEQERSRLEMLHPDVPVLPDEAPEVLLANSSRLLIRKALRRTIEDHG